MTEEQTKTTNWLDKEVKELQEQTNFDGERLPSLQFEEKKIVEFDVDFSTPFQKWDDTVNKVKKAIIPVTHNNEKKVLWLNIKNPLYGELVHKGKSGETHFKVMQIGSQKNTKYNLVEN